MYSSWLCKVCAAGYISFGVGLDFMKKLREAWAAWAVKKMTGDLKNSHCGTRS